MTEILNKLTESYWHLRGFSGIEYSHLLNLRPQDGVPRCYINEGKSHNGIDSFAMDIIIPNPAENQLEILAPADGIAGDPISVHSEVTTDMAKSWMVNTVRVYVSPNEYYEIKHFETGSCNLRLKQRVHRGQVIARTGGSGFYSDENAHHVHFAVHGLHTSNRITASPLKPRFRDYNLRYGDDGSVVFVKK